ncbi:MAG: hypothetical protein ACJ73J_11260 [Actinomycetes bacterium]
MKRTIKHRALAVTTLTVVALTGVRWANASPSPSPESTGYADCPIPTGAEPIDLSLYDFKASVTNRLWPMAPGTHWRFRESDTEGGHQRNDVTVLERTKLVDGVTTTVVHDATVEHRRLVENTFDWYAQDKCGNVWYFGENTRAFNRRGGVSREGSWEAGVDGALPGVIVPAEPVVGLHYRQEYLAGQAEDRARILSVDERASAPAGFYRHTVLTAESTALEPRVSEYKFLAPGFGPVLAVSVSGESDREELVHVAVP